MTVRALQDYLTFAEGLADCSGAILRRYFRTPLETEEKADCSPVTVADREIETLFREKIAEAYPGHGVIGEEFDPHDPEADYVWAVDPIDGTAGFITGRPLFGTLIGLLHGGAPVLGVIDHPITRERWVGVKDNGKDNGAALNGEPCRTRPCPSLGEAMLYATSPHMFPEDDKQAFDALCRAVKRPQYGLDCYAYGLLASGMIDLIAEATMKPCDCLALVPVVEAAGGYISDWAGHPLSLESDGRVLAAGDAELHRRALDILGGAAARG